MSEKDERLALVHSWFELLESASATGLEAVAQAKMLKDQARANLKEAVEKSEAGGSNKLQSICHAWQDVEEAGQRLTESRRFHKEAVREARAAFVAALKETKGEK